MYTTEKKLKSQTEKLWIGTITQAVCFELIVNANVVCQLQYIYFIKLTLNIHQTKFLKYLNVLFGNTNLTFNYKLL